MLYIGVIYRVSERAAGSSFETDLEMSIDPYRDSGRIR
jgi:hypothetical protein